MDSNVAYSQLMDQPVSQLDSKELLEFAKKNLKIFGEIEQKQFKRLEEQLKHEKELEKKEKSNRDVQNRRQKELDEINEKNYKEELNRSKRQKEHFDKTKDAFDPNAFERLTSALSLIPDKIQSSGEQKNLGEDVIKVGFNKEGTQVLKMFLDPIYEKIEANTENLNKILKNLEKGDNEQGGGLLGLLLATLAGSIIVFFEEIMKWLKSVKTAFDGIKSGVWSFIDDLKTLPSRLKSFLNLDDFFKMITTKWDEMVKTINGLSTRIGSIWDDVVNGMKTRWNNFISTVKDVIQWDELTEAFKAKWVSWTDNFKNILNFDGLTNSVKSGWTSWIDTVKKFLTFESLPKIDDGPISTAWGKISELFDKFTNTLSRWYDNTKGIWTAIMSSFEDGGIMGKIISGIQSAFETAKGAFGTLLDGIKPLLEPLKQFGQWVKPFFRFFELLAFVVDPVVAAVKTLSEIWDNDKLNVFEKSVAGLVAAFFGLADGIFSLLGLLSEGITGVWSWLTGGGWKTENAFGNQMREMTDDYSFGAFGRKMGVSTADVMAEGTGSVAYDRMKGVVGMDTSGVARTGDEDRLKGETDYDYTKRGMMSDSVSPGEIDPEEQSYLDSKFDKSGKRIPVQGEKVDDFIMQPSGISSFIYSGKNNKSYQTAPDDEIIASKKGGIIDQSLQDIKMIMAEVNKNILNMSLVKNSDNQQPVMITNNSIAGGKDSSQNIFKAMYDINTQKRSDWWRISREYSSTI